MAKELKTESIAEVISKAKSAHQLSTLFSAISQYSRPTSSQTPLFVVIKASIEVFLLFRFSMQLLCTVFLDSSNNEISEVVQTICIDIDDLSEFEVVDEINVFVKSFDFEGKQTRGRIECYYSCDFVMCREQMKLVLDFLPKLLNLCTSTSTIIDSEDSGNGQTLAAFRVRILSQRVMDRSM